MKKLISLALALVLALGVCACASAEEKTYKVGILQLVQHPALDQATQGFKDALTEKLGDKVTFEEGNASGDSNNCAQIAGQLVSSQVEDLIYYGCAAAMLVASIIELVMMNRAHNEYASRPVPFFGEKEGDA